MLFKILGLDPIELLIGLEMFDDDLKAGIAKYVKRIDENVFVAGIARDEDGNEFYLDLSQYDVVTLDKDGNLTDIVPNFRIPPKIMQMRNRKNY